MNSDTNEICGDCGATMTISTGPGRLRSYRGEGGYEMPAKLSFLACGNCGAEWMTASQIDELSDAFELQRASRSV